MDDLSPRISQAIVHFWQTRKNQKDKQETSGHSDQGSRSSVTGGAQLDGFVRLFHEIILETGIDQKYIYTKQYLELPGFFRPTKSWDLLVVKDSKLLLALELKSQVGPSFGNNFNNRTEEALGSAVDLWTAYREKVFAFSPAPFLGFFFLLEDCKRSQSEVKMKGQHFPVMAEFANASYAKRYQILCKRLILERHYTSSSLLLSDQEQGLLGHFTEPSPDLSVNGFVKAMKAHLSAYV